VPATRLQTNAEIDGDYEERTGALILETFVDRDLDPAAIPAVLVAGHGPFVWGETVEAAVENAIALEAAAAAAFRTLALADDWALQDPRDYVRSLQVTVPRLVAEAGVRPEDVSGIGLAFTSCTVLPTLRDGTPLCRLDDLRREPHAWVKLWKHHAAQPEADRINALALERDEPWL